MYREYNIRVHGLVAQLGAHHIRIVGVEGSNPFKSTKRKTTLSGGLSFGTAFTQKGFELFDATVRGTVACDGLTEQTIYFRAAKMQTNPFKFAK